MTSRIAVIGSLLCIVAACAPAEREVPAATPSPPSSPSVAPTPSATQPRAHFKAVGQEPGWTAELRGDSLQLVLDYGETRISTTVVTDSSSAAFRRYRGSDAGRAIALTIETKACEDAMSGAPYPNTVRVTVADRTYDGCGGDVSTP